MSILYHPLKALGVHSSNIPLVIKSVGNNEYYLLSAVGSYFLVYRFSNLALLATSDRIEENILSIGGYKNTVFCGCESKIYAFSRAKHVSGSYEYDGSRDWKIILVLGEEGYLCGVDGSNKLVIWDITTREVLRTFSFPEVEFPVVKLLQPRNYTNKVLVASATGQMQLINYVNNKVLYSFSLGRCEITALEQSPAVDTVAVGTRAGQVVLHNLVHDKTLMKVSNDLGAVTSIAFRTDLGPDSLVMLTGSEHGHVALWDLEKGRNVGQSRHLHQGAIATLFCLPGKPLLVTNGPDNSLKVWNYDRPDGTPVLVRSRDGHWLPPSCIRYWPGGTRGATAQLLSAGGDSALRVFSSYEERTNCSMGRAYLPGHGNHRKAAATSRDEQYVLPAAVDMAVSVAKDGWWDSVVMCHASHRPVTTWQFSKKCRGKHYLDSSVFRDRAFVYKNVTANRCAISLCGNFVVVGYSSGHVAKFNMQSGIERGTFGTPLAHEDGPIVGLGMGLTIDHTMVVTAGGQSLRLWDFDTRQPMGHKIMFDSAIATVTMHPGNDMAAVTTVDGLVHLVQLADFTVFQRVRASFRGAVTSIAFTHGFELMVVADGSLVKTFDYINNKLVDCFRVRKRVTELQIDSNDTFLVTIHEGELGLYVWSLKSRFATMQLTALSVDYEPTDVMTEAQMYCEDTEDDDDNQDDHDNGEADGENDDVEMRDANDGENRPLAVMREADSMVQLSGLAAAYFCQLANLDKITIRNETAAAKGLASTSFFMPEVTETVDGLKWRDSGDQDDQDDNDKTDTDKLVDMKHNEKKRKIDVVKDSGVVRVDQFAAMVQAATTDEQRDKCLLVMKRLSPVSIDYEIQMLDPIYHANGYGAMHAFLALLHNQLERATNVDVVLLYVVCFIKHNIGSLTDCHTYADDTAGIEGLVAQDDQDQDVTNGEHARLEALRLLHQLVNHINTCRHTSRLLTQSIEMNQFAHNNL